MYETYREEVRRHYFCARCGKEIRPNRGRVKARFTEMQILTDNFHDEKSKKSFLYRSGLDPFSNMHSEYYLCSKCCRDFSKFLNNTYKFDKEERETELLEQMENLKVEYHENAEAILFLIKKLSEHGAIFEKISNEIYEPNIDTKAQLANFRKIFEVDNQK